MSVVVGPEDWTPAGSAGLVSQVDGKTTEGSDSLLDDWQECRLMFGSSDIPDDVETAMVISADDRDVSTSATLQFRGIGVRVRGAIMSFPYTPRPGEPILVTYRVDQPAPGSGPLSAFQFVGKNGCDGVLLVLNNMSDVAHTLEITGTDNFSAAIYNAAIETVVTTATSPPSPPPLSSTVAVSQSTSSPGPTVSPAPTEISRPPAASTSPYTSTMPNALSSSQSSASAPRAPSSSTRSIDPTAPASLIPGSSVSRVPLIAGVSVGVCILVVALAALLLYTRSRRRLGASPRPYGRQGGERPEAVHPKLHILEGIKHVEGGPATTGASEAVEDPARIGAAVLDAVEGAGFSVQALLASIQRVRPTRDDREDAAGADTPPPTYHDTTEDEESSPDM